MSVTLQRTLMHIVSVVETLCFPRERLLRLPHSRSPATMQIHSLTHYLTHSLTHSLTPSFTLLDSPVNLSHDEFHGRVILQRKHNTRFAHRQFRLSPVLAAL